MYEQFSNQVLAFGKNFAHTLVKANGIAVEGFEKLVDLQLKAVEGGLTAGNEFVQQVSEVRDLDGLRTVWPKGLALVKDGAEQAVAGVQEVFGIATKTQEAFVTLVRGSVEAASDTVAGVAKTASKATKRAAA